MTEWDFNIDERRYPCAFGPEGDIYVWFWFHWDYDDDDLCPCPIDYPRQGENDDDKGLQYWMEWQIEMDGPAGLLWYGSSPDWKDGLQFTKAALEWGVAPFQPFLIHFDPPEWEEPGPWGGDYDVHYHYEILHAEQWPPEKALAAWHEWFRNLDPLCVDLVEYVAGMGPTTTPLFVRHPSSMDLLTGPELKVAHLSTRKVEKPSHDWTRWGWDWPIYNEVSVDLLGPPKFPELDMMVFNISHLLKNQGE